MSETVKATVYLQVAPEWFRFYSKDDPRGISGAKVVGSTQKRSQAPKPGTVEVKLTVEIPKTAFLPLRPEAIVVVPESLTTPHPIEVEAEDANEADQ
jgi:hypothetical protein